MPIQESDWKLLRRLHPLTLERFCGNVLIEIDAMRHDEARSVHQRYLQIFMLVKRRDRDLAAIFNNPKRSTSLAMLAHMKSAGPLTADEYATLTPDTRSAIEFRPADE